MTTRKKPALREAEARIAEANWILTAIGIGIFVGSLVIAWIEMGWRKP